MAERPYSPEELMMTVLARSMGDREVIPFGNFTPIAYGACLLAKLTHGKDIFLIGAAGIDTLPYRITLSTAGGLGAMNVSLWFGHTLIHQAGFAASECLSAAQIDVFGNLNTSLIRRRDGTLTPLPGGAGQGDTGITCHKYLVYTPRHSSRVLVPRVDFVTGTRHFVDSAARQAAGLTPGISRLVTNLAVFDLDEATHQFRLVSIHPGHSIEEVRQNTGWEITVSSAPATEPPTAVDVHLIRTKIDPLGLLPLESLPGRERIQHLYNLLDREVDFIGETSTTGFNEFQRLLV